jgi:hypothetical protein
MFTRATLSRPPHPALHVRDDRDTPLFGRGGMAREMPPISEKQKRNIFRERTGRPNHLESAHEIRFRAHTISFALEPHQRRNMTDNRIDSPVGQNVRDVKTYACAAG